MGKVFTAKAKPFLASPRKWDCISMLIDICREGYVRSLNENDALFRHDSSINKVVGKYRDGTTIPYTIQEYDSDTEVVKDLSLADLLTYYENEGTNFSFSTIIKPHTGERVTVPSKPYNANHLRLLFKMHDLCLASGAAVSILQKEVVEAVQHKLDYNNYKAIANFVAIITQVPFAFLGSINYFLYYIASAPMFLTKSDLTKMHKTLLTRTLESYYTNKSKVRSLLNDSRGYCHNTNIPVMFMGHTPLYGLYWVKVLRTILDAAEAEAVDCGSRVSASCRVASAAAAFNLLQRSSNCNNGKDTILSKNIHYALGRLPGLNKIVLNLLSNTKMLLNNMELLYKYVYKFMYEGTQLDTAAKNIRKNIETYTPWNILKDVLVATNYRYKYGLLSDQYYMYNRHRGALAVEKDSKHELPVIDKEIFAMVLKRDQRAYFADVVKTRFGEKMYLTTVCFPKLVPCVQPGVYFGGVFDYDTNSNYIPLVDDFYNNIVNDDATMFATCLGITEMLLGISPVSLTFKRSNQKSH